MPFVVVITAVAIVNNGDDNAVRFVSVLPFVVFLHFCCSTQTAFVGRRSAALEKTHSFFSLFLFFTLRAALCYCDPLF